MTTRSMHRFLPLAVFFMLTAGARPAAADSSHARIIRLSLSQGDVRFTRSAHGDPLSDPKTIWERAIVNLPIRQGYVLSTDKGRAEVEFENGAAAYLDENTVLEFYDLSLNDGARTTRLVLRQGTASFYVHPGRGDFFTVTGGDFTAQASGRASFRMDNFDNGSGVAVEKGRLSVITKSKTTELEKGQSLTVRTGDEANLSIGHVAPADDFDNWVSRREETVSTTTNSALRYVNSPYYSSGFADLYTYGSWIPYAGFGDCWRPFGVGLGWSPFSTGQWVFDPFFGWSWVGFEPWGWLPYHFGSWIFSPVYGWLWVPGGFGFGGFGFWRPSTAVWVRSGGRVGVVPVHPLDAHGKTPVNLAHGVITAPGAGTNIATRISAGAGEKWKVLQSPPRDAVRSDLAATAAPVRVSRTVLAGDSGSRAVPVGRDSSIVFDARERKFVNSNAPSSTSEGATPPVGDAKSAAVNAGRGAAPGGTRRNDARVAPPPRLTPPPSPARTFTPPPAPRTSSGTRFNSPRPAESQRGGWSRPSAAPRSSPAPASAPAPRSSSPPAPRPH